MDSNSTSYLAFLATVVLLTSVFFFLSGMKRKEKEKKAASLEHQPFELRTTRYSQLLSYLWIPLTLSIPVLVFKEIHPASYFILILILMVVLMSWFIAAQHTIEKDHEEEN